MTLAILVTLKPCEGLATALDRLAAALPMKLRFSKVLTTAKYMGVDICELPSQEKNLTGEVNPQH